MLAGCQTTWPPAATRAQQKFRRRDLPRSHSHPRRALFFGTPEGHRRGFKPPNSLLYRGHTARTRVGIPTTYSARANQPCKRRSTDGIPQALQLKIACNVLSLRPQSAVALSLTSGKALMHCSLLQVPRNGALTYRIRWVEAMTHGYKIESSEYAIESTYHRDGQLITAERCYQPRSHTSTVIGFGGVLHVRFRCGRGARWSVSKN